MTALATVLVADVSEAAQPRMLQCSFLKGQSEAAHVLLAAARPRISCSRRICRRRLSLISCCC